MYVLCVLSSVQLQSSYFWYSEKCPKGRRPTPLPSSPLRWVHGSISTGVKLLGREAGHSPPSSAEVKNVWWHTCNSAYKTYAELQTIAYRKTTLHLLSLPDYAAQ
jgi:hypothetical protein